MKKERLEEYNKIFDSGDIYNCQDQELVEYQGELVNKLREYNLTKENDPRRNELLKEMLGTYNEGITILPPVHANFGLKHVHIGKDVFINFNATFVDDGNIYIGDHTMFGPNVTIVTANHPINPDLRKYQLQYNNPVHIGNNVWIGAGAIILSGVTIGDNCVIGAGAIVTKSFEANSIIVGNPARVMRKISEKDYQFCNGKPIPMEILEKYK